MGIFSGGLWCFAVLAAIFGVPINGIQRGGSPTAEGSLSSFKAVSWNIERGERIAGVVDFLKRENPELVLLQEVDVNARRTGRIDVAEQLSRQLGMRYLFAAEFEELGQSAGDLPAYHGQAVLTTFPVRSQRVIRYRNQSDYWRPRWYLPNWAVFQRRIGGRNALVVELGEGAEFLVAYSVHLESRGTETLRRQQMEEILDDAQRYDPDTPIVVAGDFNSKRADSPIIQSIINAGFRRALGGEVTTKRGMALDWIFVRGQIRFLKGVIHKQETASDHYPLTVQLELIPPERQ